MKTMLSTWLHRRRVQSEILRSGRPVESRAVTNPFHAVSVTPGQNCCRTVQALSGKRFLSSEAPMTPLPGCDAASCNCFYTHHEDRRMTKERRVQDVWRRKAVRLTTERRQGRGRRITDH